MRRLAVTALAAMAMLASASGAPHRRLSETERLEALGRVWVFADYFNPYLANDGVDWDQALIEAIPAVRHARTDDEFFAALNAMLAKSGDPLARVLNDPPGNPPSPVEVVRVQDGAAILDCSAAGQVLEDTSNTSALINSLMREDAPRGAVVDCRDYHGNDIVLVRLIEALVQARVTTAIAGGASEVRFWDGFPTQVGTTSGGYSAGTTTIDHGAIYPGASVQFERPLVFLINRRLSYFAPQFGALQAAGRARIVSEDAFAGDAAYTRAAGVTVRMTRGFYVYPNGGVGFQPDAIIEGDAALVAAIAQLDRTGPPTQPATAHLTRARAAPRPYPGTDAPSAELRMLALYRLWGMVQYFYPYKDLMDAPWDQTLAEFAPVFLAASTREAYETAVLRLSARMDDSHASVGGLRVALYGAEPARPGLILRYREGKPIVVEVSDPALGNLVTRGDEIIRVDGRTVAQIEAQLTPLLAYSTPQALRLSLTRHMLNGVAGSDAVLLIRGVDGRLRTVRAPRLAQQPPRPTEPAWRMLDGNIGYINLELLERNDTDRALDELMNAHALIFDLRGYPQGTFWLLAPRLARHDGPIMGPQYRRPRFTGPSRHTEQLWTSFQQQVPQRDKPRYQGPVFVMIDERAVSQSETTAIFLEAAADATFVGEPTSGANGDVTTLLLPGGLQLWMTGHDVRHPDGRQLQRIGIQPDVPVSPTISGVRAGRDEILERTQQLAQH